MIVRAVTAGNYKRVVIDEYSADKVEDSDILIPCEKIQWNYELMEFEYSVFENHDSYKLNLTSNLMFRNDCLTFHIPTISITLIN